jgi:hypothetical protein
MENQDQSDINQLDNFFNIAFDAGARGQLRQVALWAKICTLCAFIGYGIALIVAIFGHKDYSLEAGEISFGAYVRSGSSISGVLVSILVGGIINYFLYRFAVAAGRGVESMDTLKVNEGFNNLRIYFKILGIILIICLSLVALGLLIGLIALGAGAGR